MKIDIIIYTNVNGTFKCIVKLPQHSMHALLADGYIYLRLLIKVKDYFVTNLNETNFQIILANNPPTLTFDTIANPEIYLTNLTEILEAPFKPLCGNLETKVTPVPSPMDSTLSVFRGFTNCIFVEGNQEANSMLITLRTSNDISTKDMQGFQQLCRTISNMLKLLGCLYGRMGRDYTLCPHSSDEVKARWDNVRYMDTITEKDRVPIKVFEAHLRELVYDQLVADLQHKPSRFKDKSTYFKACIPN